MCVLACVCLVCLLNPLCSAVTCTALTEAMHWQAPQMEPCTSGMWTLGNWRAVYRDPTGEQMPPPKAFGSIIATVLGARFRDEEILSA